MAHFPLTREEFDSIVDDVGINPPCVINKGGILCDEWGFPVGGNHAILSEWTSQEHTANKDLMVCCCTVRIFRKDGKLFFSRDYLKANRPVYIILNKQDRVVHAKGTIDGECDIIEYNVKKEFSEKGRYDSEVKSKELQLEIKNQTIQSLVKTAKDSIRYVREVALEAGYRTQQRKLDMTGNNNVRDLVKKDL